jgi:dipeptidyl aminopeptidase/acylaminoacyl peptidase
MIKYIQLLLAAFLLAAVASSCNKNLNTAAGTVIKDSSKSTTASSDRMATPRDETPIIDRATFFGNPVIAGGQLSPDGNYVTFMREHEGIMNVWIKGFNESFDQAKLLTDSDSPIPGYFWTDDSKYVLFVNDSGGDENFNVYAVDPTAATMTAAPTAKNLTPLEDVRAQIYLVSKKDPDMMMIGINDRDKAWHDLYSLKISTGELTKLFENNNRYGGYEFDWDENMRIAYRTDEDGNNQIMRVEDDGTFKEIYKTNLQESAYIANWTPDNKECYLVTNKGEMNLSTMFKMNPSTGSLTKVESDPKGLVDFGGLWINDNTREIISTSYTYDKRVRYFKDKNWENIYNKLKAHFPGKEVGFSSFTKDYSKMLVSVSGDKYATEVYFYDPATDNPILQYTPRPDLKEIEQHLSTMQPISYKSSDGTTIPAYLSIPKGTKGKNLPAVIVVHGGPKGPRDTWGYRSTVQFLNNRGYVVLQPNFRASGGYGKDFLNAGDKQWGKLMQDDITWGKKYLVNNGIANPDKVAIMGGSYGGYATLAGLAFTPDEYACGVDIVGPSNLFTLMESIPPYWEAGRKWLYEMVGDPETEEGQKLLREASPLFSADKISKPLLIVQGANDPRVKKAEADQIAIALRDKGHSVDYLLAMDEGHGFRKPLNRMAMNAQIEKFLATHLGGRYQKDVPDDVAETLRNLKVDINSVKLAEADNSAAIAALPAVTHAWSSESSNWDIALEMAGQKIPMTSSRKIEKTGNNWTVTDKASSMMGDMVDMVTYDAQFKAIRRETEQAGQKMSIRYEDNKAIASMMGKEMAIESDGAMVCDGAGFDIMLGKLGMKEGDKMTYNIADMMTMKTKKVIAEHKGMTDYMDKPHQLITVTNAENENEVTSYYYDANNVPVKVVAMLPAMNNAKMTIIRK